MDSQQPLSLNDYDDIEKELNQNKKCLSKRNVLIIVGVCIAVIIIMSVILFFLLFNKDKTPSSPEDTPTGDKSEIICKYIIQYPSNISILSEEFYKPKYFDLLIDDKKIKFTRYYFFDSEGEKEIKYIFYGDFSMENMFKDIRDLTSVDMKTEKKVKITSMKSTFESCNNLEKFNMHGFNLNNLASVNKVFSGTRISNIDMKEFNLEKIEDLSYMFAYLDIEEFNLKGMNTQNVKNMSHMFYGALFKKIELNNLYTKNVIDMSHMFSHCESLTSLNLEGIDTEHVTNMSGIFQNCLSLTSLNLKGIKTNNVIDMSHMFDNVININNRYIKCNRYVLYVLFLFKFKFDRFV